MADYRDHYADGGNVTAVAETDIVGCTFVKIAGPPAQDGSYAVTTCAAGERPFGVAKYDAAAGERLGIARGNGRIGTVAAASNLAPGVEVYSNDFGQASSAGTGIVAGTVVQSAGQDLAVITFV